MRYPNLYDLFNQRYSVISGKEYKKISPGTSKNFLSFDNKSSKLIVIIDEKEDLKKIGTMFLNQFEKHTLLFESCLKKNYKDLAEKYRSYFKYLVTPQIPGECQIELESQLINCGRDEIQALVLDGQNQNIVPGQMFEYIFSKIVPTLSQDIIAFGKDSKLMTNQEGLGIYKAIVNFYKQKKQSNIVEFLKEMSHTKNVIYTFSSIFEKLKIPRKGVKNKKINKVIKEEDIESSVLTAKDELKKVVEKFYSNDKQICLIWFRLTDYDKLDEVIDLIDSYEMQRELQKKNKKIEVDEERNKDKKGYFILLIENTRIFKIEDEKKLEEMRENILYKKTLISNLSSFTQIFIDDINGKQNNLTDLVNLQSRKLLKNLLIKKKKNSFQVKI